MRKRISFVACPECKIFTFQKIISTVVDDEHRILRRRNCLDCGHKWYTVQQPEVSVENMTTSKFLNEQSGV